MGQFTLKFAELNCSLLFSGSPPLPTFHPYVGACGVNKNYFKWWEIQLAMLCEESSLIGLE